MGQIINTIQAIVTALGLMFGGVAVVLDLEWGWPLIAVSGVLYIEAAIYRLSD